MHFSRSPFIAFAVTAMIGTSLQRGDPADLADRVDAVHLRHHDVHQDRRRHLRLPSAIRRPRDRCRGRRSACPCPRAARTARRCCACRRRRSSRLRPASTSLPSCSSRSSARCGSGMRSGWRCRSDAVWSSRASGEPASAHDHAPSERRQPSARLRRLLHAVEDHRQRILHAVLHRRCRLRLLQVDVADWCADVPDRAVDARLGERFSRRTQVTRRHHAHVVTREILGEPLQLRCVAADREQRRFRRAARTA